MARFELRNATVRLVDGYANTAAVDGTLVNGDTEMNIDTVDAVDPSGDGSSSQVIPVSSRFSMVGSIKTYTVLTQDANAILVIDLDAGTGNYTITVAGQETANIAHTDAAAAILAALELLSTVDAGDLEVTKDGNIVTVKAASDGQYADTALVMSGDISSLTGGSPTATQTEPGGQTHTITFSPAIATPDGIPADDAVMTFGGRQLEIKIGEGTLDFTEARAFIYDLDRGNLDSVRQDSDVPLSVSMAFVWEFLVAISGASTPTPREVLYRQGPAANWKSSSDDACEPYAVDIEVSHLPPCGGEAQEDITLPDFRFESLDYSGADAQISVSGQCNATQALVARGA